MIPRIDRWLADFKDKVFLYRDGFFELPFLSNSPELMMDVAKRRPFSVHDAAASVITTNNPFTAGTVHYRELAEGLWVTVSDVQFKKNICVKLVYDKGPKEYYFLTNFQHANISAPALPVTGWGFYTPGTLVKRYFKKGDKGVFLNFAFSTQWLERNIPAHDIGHDDLNQYFKTANCHIVLDHKVAGADELIGKILELVNQQKPVQFSNLTLKMHILDVIMRFFVSIDRLKGTNGAIVDPDSSLVKKAEAIIAGALMLAFPGIAQMAAVLHTSETKLKTSFKAAHQTSIYQYYRQQQMDLALTMLKTQRTSLKNIAHTFGYDNPGKFSAAFKKRHNLLPSEV